MWIDGEKLMGRKHGSRNKLHYANYKNNHTREKHKIKRVLQSNGIKAAKSYATKHGMSVFLSTLTNGDL